jgi:hypothetical protein
MAAGDHYRFKAAEMYAKGRAEPNEPLKRDFENLALAYLRLADQADRNADTDVVYETPTERPQPPK